MKLAQAVGHRLQQLLQQKNITQYELCKRGGIPRPTICVLIQAKYNTVKLDTIYQICAALEISLHEFFDSPLFADLED